MILSHLTKGNRTIAVIDTQWGDCGKGKIVDLLGDWADITIRYNGGANSGHTVKIGKRTFAFHLVPSGILRDGEGKVNIMGRGMVIYPKTLVRELFQLREEGGSYDNLIISKDANLLLPQHVLLDKLSEALRGTGKIGTTGRGIGPAYGDHILRRACTMNDLLNPDVLRKKIRNNLEFVIPLLRSLDPEVVREAMSSERLESGLFWDPDSFMSVDAVTDSYLEYARELEKMIRDLEHVIRNSVGRKNVLLESGQGILLSIDRGTYPYVTSSDPSIVGLHRGSDVHESEVDLTIGVVKAPYMTRVGAGPFPTELGGVQSDAWCAYSQVNRQLESDFFHNASINADNEPEQGIAIRVAGDEYGTTTGRPRRVGWLDLPLLKYALRYCGKNVRLALMKMDVMDKAEKIKLCRAHVYKGDEYRVGETSLREGRRIYDGIPDPEILSHCEPEYEELAGWMAPTQNLKNFADAPQEMKRVVERIEAETGNRVGIVSVGPDREETLIL